MRSLVETWSHYPFGEQWEQSGSGGNERRFTGHRRDPETGNDDAGARLLKSSRARWLSTDPALGDLSSPQRLNRYQYVRNDAVNLCVEVNEKLPASPPSVATRGLSGLFGSPATTHGTWSIPGHVEVVTEFQNTGQVRDRNADLDLGWFRPRDVTRVQAGIDTAVELAERSECDTALSAYGIVQSQWKHLWRPILDAVDSGAAV